MSSKTSAVRQLSSLNLLYCGDGLAIAEIDLVCVVIWREAVTAQRFEIQRAALENVVTRNKPHAGFLCVIEADVKPPSEELRRASSNMLATHQKNLRCAGGVIEGSGFKAALTRSVLSGMTLLMGERKSPISYFATVEEASLWMGGYMSLQPERFAKAVEALRSQLGPAAAASAL